MNIDVGKTLRMADWIDSADGRCLLLDTSITSCVGATEGLDNLTHVLERVNLCCDGVVVNPGQAEHQAAQLGGKSRASPIVRVDWSNAFRDKDFCLPVSEVQWRMISDGPDALHLGASAVLAGLYLGFDDDFEADNIQKLSTLARECQSLSMPVIVDIRPIGHKITQKNDQESIKLGVSFMQELGADALIIPKCTPETSALIGSWIQVPVLMRWNELPSGNEVQDLWASGLCGIVLSEGIFSGDKPIERVQKLHDLIHDRGSM